MPTLTPEDALSYLNNLTNGEGDMRLFGRIRTREKCPVCNQPYSLIKDGENDIVCIVHRTRPKHYHLKIKENRITKDRDGHWLDSHDRAKGLLEEIRRKVEERRFRLEDYLQREIEQFRGYKLFPAWLKSKQHLSTTYKADIERWTNELYIPFFEKKDMCDIRGFDIEKFKDSLPPKQRLNKDGSVEQLHPKAVQNILMTLRSFFTWMVDREYITQAQIPKFPRIKVPRPKKTFIGKEDQLKVLSFIPERHKPIFAFLFFHPVRISEATVLKVKDFDLKMRSVYIYKAFDRHRNEKGLKADNPHYLPLSNTFDISILKDKLPETYVFQTFTGKTYTTSILYKIWDKARKKAKLPPLPLKNATRHSGLTQALNRGVNPVFVQNAAGHKNLQTTLDSYVSVEFEQLRSIVDGEIVPMREEEAK